MKPKRWYKVFLFFVALLSSACSVMGIGPEPTPTRPPISNLTQESLRQQQLNCLTCSDAEYKQIILDHVGERVRWTNTVFVQEDATTLTLFNHHFSVVLKGVPNETMGKLREGMIITVEGTITHDSQYGWVLTDVEIDPIVGIDTPQPEIAIENVNLEVTSVYKVTFTLSNTSGQPVETCFFVSLSFDDDGYYRLLQNEKNDGKCVDTVPVGESTYTYRLGPVKSDDEYVGELEVELRALKDNDIVVWDSWGSIARHTEVIQVQEYAYNPDIVVKIDTYKLTKVGNHIKFRLEMHNWSGFDVTTCIKISVSPVNSDEVIELAELKGSCLVTLTDRDQAISYDLGVQDFRYADVVITVLTEDESAVIEEWAPDNVYVWD